MYVYPPAPLGATRLRRMVFSLQSCEFCCLVACSCASVLQLASCILTSCRMLWPRDNRLTLARGWYLDPGAPTAPLKNHHILNLSPGLSEIRKSSPRVTKRQQNVGQSQPPGHQISEEVKKVKSPKTHSFYTGCSACSHCIPASFPSLDHQNHGPGNCFPFCHPRS